jgi:hypothetical protein
LTFFFHAIRNEKKIQNCVFRFNLSLSVHFL